MSASVLPDGITVYVYARTDVGMKRQGNEDSFLIADLSSGRLGLGPEVTAHQLGQQGSLMIVSDGLGGAAAGEVASAMAVQTVCTELMKTTKSVLSPDERLKRATEQANEQIWSCAQSDNSLRGMGATLTAAFIYGNSVYIAQVGDSRAYIVRGGRVKQVTEDQSWANAVKKAGLDVGDVPNNVILQALGTQPKVHVEVTSVDLLNGDVLLLCSDGLSNKIKDLEMREIANSSQDLAENCRQFIELANKRGGEDNITVVLARFVGKSLLSGMESDLSITSTFKVVTPLDFGDSMDENETMSFQGEQDPKKDVPDPMAITQSALLDAIPTLSNLPSLPSPATNAKELPKTSPVAATSPLGSKPAGKESKEISLNTSPLTSKDIEVKSSKSSTVSPEKAAFRQADTKTDLPAVPVFDLSKEPVIESKPEPEPDVKIEFVPTPVEEPRIQSSSVLAKSPDKSKAEFNLFQSQITGQALNSVQNSDKPGEKPTGKSDIIALPPKPPGQAPIPTSSSNIAKSIVPVPPMQNTAQPPIAPPRPIVPSPMAEPKAPVLPPSSKASSEAKQPLPPLPPLPNVLPKPSSTTPAVAQPPILPPPLVPSAPATKPVAPVVPPSVFSGPGLVPPPVPAGVPTTKPSIPVPTTKPSSPVAETPSGLSGQALTPPPAPIIPVTKPSTPVVPSSGIIPKPPLAPPPIVPSGLVPPPQAEAKPLPPVIPAPIVPPISKDEPKLPLPALANKPETGPVPPALSGNLFAPPPKPVVPSDKEAVAPPKFAPPPATLPSAPLNLFVPDANATSPIPKAAPSALSGGLFAPPPKASSPNAPKVDDFLENSLFSPASPIPPKPIAPPPSGVKLPPLPISPKGAAGDNLLENSLFTPPSPLKVSEAADPILGTSSPGLIFPEAFKEKTAPPSSAKTLDDEPDPIMLETLSVATPEEPKDFKPEAKSPLFAPPSGAPLPPLVPPPVSKTEPNKPTGANPLFAPPSANRPPQPAANPIVPPMNPLPPPMAAKPEAGTSDPKANKTGVEVLASLFSAPGKPGPTPSAPSAMGVPPPPMAKAEIPKQPEVAKDPLKPAPPALVLPPSPKKADVPSVVPPPLKPSIPAIAPPPIAPPPKPLGGVSIPPPPTEDKSVKWTPKDTPNISSDSPTLSPGKSEQGEKKAPLFSPPPAPAPSKPLNLPPPPGPPPAAKTGIPPVAVPPGKVDLPPAPKPAPAVNLPPAPVAAKSPALPPPPAPVSSKPSSFEDEPASALTSPTRSSEATAFSEVSTGTTPKKESPINPKLIAALGVVILVIISVGVVIFIFLGKGQNTQSGSNSTVTPTPVVNTNPETPVPSPSPVATTKPQTNPTQSDEPPVPKDTPGLIKYALSELNKIIDRAQKEMPDSDPTKEVNLRPLRALRDQLSEYVTKNVATDEARSYAETALSRVKGLRTQLDALPKAAGKGGKKGR